MAGTYGQDGSLTRYGRRMPWPPAATSPMSMAAPMELDAAPPATSDGPPVPDDDGEESDGPNNTANEWEMVCRTDGKLRLEVLPAGYNFRVPDMPIAAIVLPFRIMRFVEFVVGDGGTHCIHNLGLNMRNHSWVFSARGTRANGALAIGRGRRKNLRFSH